MKEKYKKIKPCFFVVPDFSAFVSGGNIYNEALIAALQSKNYPCQNISFDEFAFLFKKEESALFFIDTLFLKEIAPLLLLPRNGAEIWLIVHHLESLYPPVGTTSSNYFKTYEAPLLKLFDGFLTSSQFTANYLQQQRGLSQKTIVVPPAVKYFPKSIPKKSSTKIHALLVANLVERKGIFPFLQAFSQLDWTTWQDHLQITIIGSKTMSPEYAEACRKIVDESPILTAIVQLKGTVPETKVPSFYQQANLFISTAFMETYGMALQEASLFQLPLLAVNGGNVKTHLEDGKNGFLLANPMEVALSLKQLCEHRSIFQNLLENAKNKALSSPVYHWEEAADLFAHSLIKT